MCLRSCSAKCAAQFLKSPPNIKKIGAQIDSIASRLEKEQQGLLTDNKMLDELYGQNKAYFDALNIYIAAAKMKLQELDAKTIPEAMAKAQASGDQMQVQEVNDLKQFQTRLEKRAYDLELARQITLQQAPQIRLIQNTNQALAEKNPSLDQHRHSIMEEPSGNRIDLVAAKRCRHCPTPSL